MTKVKKPVRRETHGGVFSQGKLRPVIVSVEPPNVIGFRLKGTRRTYYLTAEGCYLKAVQAAIAAEKREKAKARKEKKAKKRRR
ncbi:MAG: hypothetical protein ACXAC5_02165 [Promethearchaeota archaeon]|jgi:hypothetical protein